MKEAQYREILIPGRKQYTIKTKVDSLEPVKFTANNPSGQTVFVNDQDYVQIPGTVAQEAPRNIYIGKVESTPAKTSVDTTPGPSVAVTTAGPSVDESTQVPTDAKTTPQIITGKFDGLSFLVVHGFALIGLIHGAQIENFRYQLKFVVSCSLILVRTCECIHFNIRYL